MFSVWSLISFCFGCLHFTVAFRPECQASTGKNCTFGEIRWKWAHGFMSKTFTACGGGKEAISRQKCFQELQPKDRCGSWLIKSPDSWPSRLLGKVQINYQHLPTTSIHLSSVFPSWKSAVKGAAESPDLGGSCFLLQCGCVMMCFPREFHAISASVDIRRSSKPRWHSKEWRHVNHDEAGLTSDPLSLTPCSITYLGLPQRRVQSLRGKATAPCNMPFKQRWIQWSLWNLWWLYDDVSWCLIVFSWLFISCKFWSWWSLGAEVRASVVDTTWKTPNSSGSENSNPQGKHIEATVPLKNEYTHIIYSDSCIRVVSYKL